MGTGGTQGWEEVWEALCGCQARPPGVWAVVTGEKGKPPIISGTMEPNILNNKDCPDSKDLL